MVKLARTGTHVIADLDANRDVTVVEYGMNDVNEIVQRELAAHNTLVADMMAILAMPTVERLMRTGSGDRFEFAETDELARDRTQKTQEGQTVGLPLRRYSVATGWDYEMMQIITLGEVQRTLLRVQQGDLANIQRAVKTALFNPLNYSFFDEYGLPQADLPVKALYNGDGTSIDMGPNTEVFDGATHNHYAGSATLTEALIDNAVRTVVEHGYEQGVEIYINEANTADLTALAKFTPALGPLITPGIGAAFANVQNDGGRITNSTVGVWDGKYFVRTKQWVPAGYFVVIAAGQAEEMRPLAFREHQRPNVRGLQTVGENENYPLKARYFRRFFGVGVMHRASAAIGQFTSATYAQPSFN